MMHFTNLGITKWTYDSGLPVKNIVFAARSVNQSTLTSLYKEKEPQNAKSSERDFEMFAFILAYSTVHIHNVQFTQQLWTQPQDVSIKLKAQLFISLNKRCNSLKAVERMKIQYEIYSTDWKQHQLEKRWRLQICQMCTSSQ